jgi:hypothetical protein
VFEQFVDIVSTDVFIQDAHNDLNVYIETLPDGTKRTKNDGQSSCGDQQRSACCGSNSSTAEDKELSKLAVEIGDTDLNEWIGEYFKTPITPPLSPALWYQNILLTTSVSRRIVQNIRSETLSSTDDAGIAERNDRGSGDHVRPLF